MYCKKVEDSEVKSARSKMDARSRSTENTESKLTNNYISNLRVRG